MMRRSTFKPKASAPLPKPAREEKFASFHAKPSPSRMAVNLAERPTAKPTEKLTRKERTKQSIRDSARGEECTVRIVGACKGGTDTTVLAHLPGIDGDRGMGIKSFDLCSAYACMACHDVVDGRAPLPPGASRTSVTLDFYAGHMRTLVRFGQKGLV